MGMTRRMLVRRWMLRLRHSVLGRGRLFLHDMLDLMLYRLRRDMMRDGMAMDLPGDAALNEGMPYRTVDGQSRHTRSIDAEVLSMAMTSQHTAADKRMPPIGAVTMTVGRPVAEITTVAEAIRAIRQDHDLAGGASLAGTRKDANALAGADGVERGACRSRSAIAALPQPLEARGRIDRERRSLPAAPQAIPPG